MSDTSVSESKEKGVNKIENNFILTGEQHISISPISRLPIFWCGSSGVGLCILGLFEVLYFFENGPIICCESSIVHQYSFLRNTDSYI